MEKKIELTLSELESLLHEQKEVVGDYITRNLSIYSFFQAGINTDLIKQELQKQCRSAKFPNDFNVLKKYIK